MAKKKKKRTTNKSQVIRDYMAKHPRAKPKEAAEAISATGVKVTSQQVSTVKFNAKKKRGAKRGRRRTAAGRATARANGVPFEALVDAKRLAKRLGGIDKAKQALAMLEKLA